jgi:hypothetical protein
MNFPDPGSGMSNVSSVNRTAVFAYHDFIGFATTGSVVVNYSATRDLYTGTNTVNAISDASLINYSPPFTSSQPETVAKKLSESISVRDFGAVGDGVADDTAAIQAALSSVGKLTITNPYLQSFTLSSVGGATVLFPPGKYLVTDTLMYGSSTKIVGQRFGAVIVFSPPSPKHLFVINPDLYAWSTETETFTMEDLWLLAGNSNALDGIHAVNTNKARFKNVHVRGFSGNGFYLGGTGYYNILEGCEGYNNYVNVYLDSIANSTQIIGGTYSHSATYFVPYNIINKTASLFVSGASLEGNVTIAQIQDTGPGTTIVGSYVEVPGGVGTVKPVVQRDMSATYNYYGGGQTMGLIDPQVAFTNFDQVASDVTQTINVEPSMFDVGSPLWVDVIPNGRMSKGLYNWFQSVGSNHGTITHDPATLWGGFGSLKLTSNGGGDNALVGVFNNVSNYINRRLYITAVVKTDANSQSEQFFAYGAGNTLIKISALTKVDYGNGWKMYVVDLPILSSAPLVVQLTQTSAVNGAVAWVTAIHAYVDGYPYLPWGNNNRYTGTTYPSSGTWSLGDIFWNTAPMGTGYVGWVYATNSSPNLVPYSEPIVGTQLADCTSGVTQANFTEGGLINGAQFAASTGITEFARFEIAAMLPSTQYTFSVYVVMDDASAPVVSESTNAGDFALVIDSTFTGSPTVTNVSGALYRVNGTLTTGGTLLSTQTGVNRYAGQSGKAFRISGFQLIPGSAAGTYSENPSTSVGWKGFGTIAP